MRHFNLIEFLGTLDELKLWEGICEDRRLLGYGKEETPDLFQKKTLVEIYKKCQSQCRHLDLRQSLKRLSGPAMKTLFLVAPPTWDAIGVEFKVLREAMEAEVADRRFSSVDPARQETLEELIRPSAEWGAIWKKFPKSKKDSEDAVYSFVSELDTACVFHAMRIAEHGLRKLAKNFKVQLIDKGNLQPYEHAEWDKIITGINSAITSARLLPKGAKRKTQLEYLSDAAQHCMYMKDIWRNSVSHANDPYSPDEAIGALRRVKDFMVSLGRSL